MALGHTKLPTSNDRLQNFAMRKAGNPYLIAVPKREWEYIPIHPCADETDLLAKLNYLPENCLCVDFYWQCGSDISFVQVQTQSVLPNQSPGIYARYANNEVYLFNIVAIIPDKVVTTNDLCALQERCVALGFLGKEFLSTSVGPNLTYIGSFKEDVL